MEGKRSSNDLLLVGFVVAAALVRLVPHPPNFLPTTALVLFAGSHFASRKVAGFVVMGSLLLSDLLLGFHSTMPFVYVALLVILLAARVLKDQDVFSTLGAGRVAGVTLGSSVFFFVLTNLGVFLVQDLYPKTLTGLLACYTAALPFFENSLLADGFYVALLFGSWELLRRSEGRGLVRSGSSFAA